MGCMTEQILFSRGDLVAFEGVDDDALQFWFREGLMIPEPAEPRKHRRFNEGEAKIAAILGEARRLGLNVHALRALAEGVRGALRYHVSLLDDLGPDASPEAQIEAADRVGEAHYEALLLAWTVRDCGGIIGLHLDAQAVIAVRSVGTSLNMTARSQILFNLDQILAPFRSQQ
jgi:DNA-binding transcriptional MerR regulator